MGEFFGYYSLSEKPEFMDVVVDKYLKKAVNSFKKTDLFFLNAEKFAPLKNLIVITSDMALYNRDDLIDSLQLKKSDCDTYTNNQLLFEAYKKWGYSLPEKLNGDFSFAIFDDNKKELFCCRSPMGLKTFYYHAQQGLFMFSNNIKKIVECCRLEIQLNDNYIKRYIDFQNDQNVYEHGKTFYKDINQLPAGFCMSVGKYGIKEWPYWKIEKTNELILKNDKEYEEAFRAQLKRAVNSRLGGKTGVLFSSGFDSGAVGAFAAAALSEKNETLYSFTSIPIKQYDNWLAGRLIADESVYVKPYKQLYNNFKQFFMANENENSYARIDEYLKILQQPYGFIENSFWLIEAVKKARENDIDVLLTGQLGNATISWGSFYLYINYLLKNKKIREYFSQIKKYAQKRDANGLRVFIRTILNQLPPRFKNRILFKRKREDEISDFIPLNRKYFKSESPKSKGFEVEDSLSRRITNLERISSTNSGVFHTQLGLKYDVLISDPTADKDLIQFCLNLPENQYVKDGERRSIFKRAMKGYMPEAVLSEKFKGMQSVDWVQRIKPYWPRIKEELLSVGDFALEKKYLDRAIVQKNLKALDDFDFIRGDNLHMRILFRTLVFSRFLRMIEKGTLFD